MSRRPERKHSGKWPQEFRVEPAHIIAGTGETVTCGELDDRSNRLAQLMWETGLRRGDHMALVMENRPRDFEACRAAPWR
jgi:long-chain acyl-CoA synthetase